jgi:hypothetical protein
MRKGKPSSADDRRPIIAGFTREDFERLNRLTHARNLRSIVKCTKWLNDHGVELLRQYPQEFRYGTGMTAEQYLHALTVHVDCCLDFLKRTEELPKSPTGADAVPPNSPDVIRETSHQQDMKFSA